MAQWGASCESGILRKNKPKDSHEDLLVFGYACKLFRDDEKALYIDNGKHLIPWMGDDKLLIDRYDGRGALSDLKPYEASREGYDATRWLGLNESERKIEHLCDKERYYSLQINEEEEQMYKEEELKRQRANEFQYTYDVPENQKEIGPVAPELEEEDIEFVPPPQLDVPVDIEIPRTVKENARIEKTALFVCKQGPQMEILIKAKQADNPQFGFLNQGHQLNKYYRHVLSAIKNGTYHVETSTQKSDDKSEKSNNEKNEMKTSNENQTDDHYLHPSLLSTTTSATSTVSNANSDVQTSSIPTIPYKPSANCSYFQLVNRIQGNQSTTTTGVGVGAGAGGGNGLNGPDASQQLSQADHQLRSQEAFSQMSYEQQQQYYQYYYAAQYYEYYKQMAQYQQGNGQPGQTVQPPETNLDPNIQNYIQQMAYAQYMQQQQQQQAATNTNPYAQIVSKVKDVSNPYTAMLANLQQEFEQNNPNIPTTTNVTIEPGGGLTQPPTVTTTIPAAAAAAVAVASPTTTTTIAAATTATIVVKPEETRTVTYHHPQITINSDVEIKKPLLALAQYGSDSDTDNDSDNNNDNNKLVPVKKDIKIPIGDIQIVIDKMASYVAKNGQQFEEIVKAKGDPRFEFLNYNHEFNEYYKKKLKECKDEQQQQVPTEKREVRIVESSTVTTTTTTTPPTPPKPKEKKVIAPVCFSIKKQKDDTPKEIKSALPIEESDEDEPTTTTTTTTTNNDDNSQNSIKSSTHEEISTTTTMTTTTTSTAASVTVVPPTLSTNTSNSSITTTTVTNTNNVPSNDTSNDSTSKNGGIFDSDDPILEMIDLTDDIEERKDARRAEDRIKDKLAAAAREKMVSVLRDRALQLERKKKAAAFLNKMKAAEKEVISKKSTSDVVVVQKTEPAVVVVVDDKKRSLSKERTTSKEIVHIEDSADEEDNHRRRSSSSKKKKSHKRKHSKSKHESRSRKKSKKKRRRSDSNSSTNSKSS